MKAFFFFIAFLALSLGYTTSLSAQSGSELRERIQNRLPQVEKLKTDGLVGENNRGFLEGRQRLNAEQEAVVKAENADRKQVYEFIAGRSDSTADFVGRQRARQIAERSAAGIWLQNERGEWHRK